MQNNLLNLDFYISLKNDGVPASDALHIAIDRGLGELLLIRMLRGVYELSFDEATNLVRQQISLGDKA